MATVRMLPPTASPVNPAPLNPINVNGRTYSASDGYCDVPDFDGAIMGANGWIHCGEVGTTAQRPAATLPNNGRRFFDTTLGKMIIADGAARVWRDPATGDPA